MAAGRPYAGVSAGAAIAAEQAIVGGWRQGGRAVCPPDTAEDLEPVTVVPGLALVPFAVDVHAAQWGTLGRLCAAVAAGLVVSGVAIDEDTALVVDADGLRVVGAGAVHVVTPDGPRVGVRTVAAGGRIQWSGPADATRSDPVGRGHSEPNPAPPGRPDLADLPSERRCP